tara:strand:+ start:527 stop:928 length:402 start_codon:yes stop_codon:yes gene_type:complete
MKVGIVGSRRYENRKKIKDFIFKLKKEYGEDTKIISGGAKDGADRYAKKYALELGLQYEEYPPAHFPHNLYCPLPQSRYGKEYSPKNYHVRNKIIAGTSDFIVAFKRDGDSSPGTMSTINYAKKFGKKYIIIS